jgi:hypothetical protein
MIPLQLLEMEKRIKMLMAEESTVPCGTRCVAKEKRIEVVPI